jgi:AGCS family alanine or glycine:cation symporter
MQWGVKRAIFSSEIGFANASAPAASAEVSHPAKQGLVQAFSVYVDTLFVCTATGLTLVITGCYNVTSPDGTFLFTGISESIPAGSGWVMEAFSTVFGFAPQFVGIALFFFAFTTILNQNYSANTYMSWFFRDKEVQPMWSKWVVNIIYLVCPIIGAFFTMQGAWDVGDVGIGLTVWVNTLFLIFFGLVPCRKLLKNFEMHQKAGEDEIFDPDEFEGETFDNADLDLWRDIRDGYRKGALKE